MLNPCYCHSRPENSGFCANNRSEDSFVCQVPVITCAGDQSFNLSQVFFKVNKSISEDNRKYFEWFYLSNTGITSLEANTLWGIHFKNVYIRQCDELKTIDPMAFTHSSQFVKHIWINATKLSDKIEDKRNTFRALNSLTNLKTMEVIGSRFTSIPSIAFNEYSSVKSISFHNQKERQYLKKINTKAFHRLTHLKRIDLRHNRISKINSFAFSFETHSNQTLRIHLEDNHLNGDSFSPNALIGGNGRRVILYLGGYDQCNEGLKRLDREVFEPFLLENKKNVIEMYGCPIECDENAVWMDTRKNILTKRIKHLKCIPNMVLTKVKSNHIIISNQTSIEPKIKSLTKRRHKLESKSQKKSKNSKIKSKTKPNKTQMTLKIRLGV